MLDLYCNAVVTDSASDLITDIGRCVAGPCINYCCDGEERRYED
ncbi:hypothetical protein GMORB2_1434 [Geosmithia morbida]|uniref:Uncharacterized protein n=1 Tax=Geosmithia morbida TaxID=1094350 RepID=A0A9P4Z006_9HYPO|nr:uncharacterized protein GMORB2_1434 [Geosmithia morbida]KAF4126188.1 hypothetical protein GMORB2_1434 [Geosmithia morbida]